MHGGKKVVLALGSNMGNRLENLSCALSEISKICRVLKVSCVYKTEPVGYANQDDFLNAVVLCQTEISPDKLLDFCKETESKMGREKSFRNAPRPIDIDIILFESVSMKTERLEIPHPRWSERDFVISPLLDVFDELLLDVDFKCDVRAILSTSKKNYKPVADLKYE